MALPRVAARRYRGLVSETTFAVIYAVLWAILFGVLFGLGRRSRELQATLRQIKKNLYSGWPSPD